MGLLKSDGQRGYFGVVRGRVRVPLSSKRMFQVCMRLHLGILEFAPSLE